MASILCAGCIRKGIPIISCSLLLAAPARLRSLKRVERAGEPGRPGVGTGPACLLRLHPPGLPGGSPCGGHSLAPPGLLATLHYRTLRMETVGGAVVAEGVRWPACLPCVPSQKPSGSRAGAGYYRVQNVVGCSLVGQTDPGAALNRGCCILETDRLGLILNCKRGRNLVAEATNKLLKL